MSDAAAWKLVSQFSGSAGFETDPLRRFDAALRRAEITPRRLERGSDARALAIPVRLLVNAAGDEGGLAVPDVLPAGDDPRSQVLFLAADDRATGELFSSLAGGRLGLGWPAWAGAPESEDAVRGRLRGAGVEVAGDSGTLTLDDQSGPRVTFGLVRLRNRTEVPPALRPGPTKIPEGSEHLRGREAWFKQRSGGRD